MNVAVDIAMPDTRRGTARHMPGEAGVWVFIFGDMLIFALFFITYVWYRSQAAEDYDRWQLMLDQRFGLLNTLLLLTSSWFLALAVRAYRQGRTDLCRRLIPITTALGGAFIVAKGFEWTNKFDQGITILTNEFFMFYYMFTGIHLLHVVIGLGVLGFLFLHVGNKRPAAEGISVVEGAAAFWHLVDLLWVVLFALLYLMR